VFPNIHACGQLNNKTLDFITSLRIASDPLRGDPRFEKIVEEAKQRVALK